MNEAPVSARLGTSDHSFTYVARWSHGATELMKETAARVVGCSKPIWNAWMRV